MRSGKHAGLIQFFGLVVKWGHRAKVFLQTMYATFSDFLDAMREPFHQLGLAFEKVQTTMANLTGEVDGMTPTMNTVRGVAVAMGKAAGTAVWAVVTAVTVLLRYWSGVVEAFRTVKSMAQPFLKPLERAFESISEALMELGEELGFVDGKTAAWGDVFEAVGDVIGTVVSVFIMPAIAAFGLFMDTISIIIRGVTGLVSVLKAVFTNIGDFWSGLKDYIFETGDASEKGLERMGTAVGS